MANGTKIDTPEAPQGVSFAEVARQTDKAATQILEAMVMATGVQPPVIAGAVSAITRLQLASMPKGTQPFQVLQVLAPMVQNVAQQLVNMRDGAGAGAQKIPDANPVQSAFDALQRCLAEAVVPTLIFQTGGDLILISIEVHGDGQVRTFATLVDVDDVRASPQGVVAMHVSHAVQAWGKENEAIHRALGAILHGLSADEATTILLEHLAGIVVRSSPDLPTALAIVEGFQTDLRPAVESGWMAGREEAGHG